MRPDGEIHTGGVLPVDVVDGAVASLLLRDLQGTAADERAAERVPPFGVLFQREQRTNDAP